jgi:hypothetical protein
MDTPTHQDPLGQLLACGLQLELIRQRIQDRKALLGQHPRAMAPDSRHRLVRLIAMDEAKVAELEHRAGIA